MFFLFKLDLNRIKDVKKKVGAAHGTSELIKNVSVKQKIGVFFWQDISLKDCMKGKGA